MFWKLVKYELQSVRKWYLGIYGIAILLSIPLGLMLRKLTVTFEHSHKEPSLLFMAFFTLIVIATIVVWGTIYIATIVLIIKRFATSVFGREGYLSNTLPVSAHQLILSKLLAAFILDTISSLVVLASIGIIATFNLDMKDILLTTSYFGQILKEMGALYLFIPTTILGTLAVSYSITSVSVSETSSIITKFLWDLSPILPFRLSYSLLVSSLESVHP